MSLVCLAWDHEFEIPDEVAEILLVRPLQFLLEYRSKDGLPLPSFDLWEERRGVHTYTVATVIRAFRDAARHAGRFGFDPAKCSEAADQMTHALTESMFDEEQGHFVRCLRSDGSPDSTPDSSTLHVGLLAALPIDHPFVSRTATAVRKHLSVNSSIGGIARYEGDYYFRQSEHFPGNPWLICTLWLGQHYALSGDQEQAQIFLDLAASQALSTGLLPEQVHPVTGAPLSVCPLTWSHAEFMRLARMLQAM